MRIVYYNIHIFQLALLLMFITTSTCFWPPPHQSRISLDDQQVSSIASMAYSFEFDVSCDVVVVQTLIMNYTSGTFGGGFLDIPQEDYDSLIVERIWSDNNEPVTFKDVGDNTFHKIHYQFPEVTGPLTKTLNFKYKAVQATKTFSRSGSSKNSFSWPTITKRLGSSIGTLDVVLNFNFHTQQNTIDCNPNYSTINMNDTATTVTFATQNNIPINTEQTHQISFPKRITCKPASSYKLIAIAVVAGSILFAVVTTIVALIVRKTQQKNSERFEQLNEVS